MAANKPCARIRPKKYYIISLNQGNDVSRVELPYEAKRIFSIKSFVATFPYIFKRKIYTLGEADAFLHRVQRLYFNFTPGPVDYSVFFLSMVVITPKGVAYWIPFKVSRVLPICPQSLVRTGHDVRYSPTHNIFVSARCRSKIRTPRSISDLLDSFDNNNTSEYSAVHDMQMRRVHDCRTQYADDRALFYKRRLQLSLNTKEFKNPRAPWRPVSYYVQSIKM